MKLDLFDMSKTLTIGGKRDIDPLFLGVHVACYEFIVIGLAYFENLHMRLHILMFVRTDFVAVLAGHLIFEAGSDFVYLLAA